jgi:glutamyl/glutaminyl-tRNA synthetase
MYEACIKLMKAGKAYADDTAQEIMQDQRMDGIASACRDMSVEDTLIHFEQMKSGSSEGLRWCIRAKISVDNPNKALRDPCYLSMQSSSASQNREDLEDIPYLRLLRSIPRFIRGSDSCFEDK